MKKIIQNKDMKGRQRRFSYPLPDKAEKYIKTEGKAYKSIQESSTLFPYEVWNYSEKSCHQLYLGPLFLVR